MYRVFFSLMLLTFTSVYTDMKGQAKDIASAQAGSVFYIGEDEKQYEKLVQSYDKLLFTVFSNNMDLAYENWTNLLKDIEVYSEKSNIDLKGVKLWLNVFWDSDGSIDYIVFYPKPNSKNLNYDLVKQMLTGFLKTYQSPIKSNSKFSHYGSAAFPVFSKSMVGPEK